MKRQLIFYLLTFDFLSCGVKETENFETQNEKFEIPPPEKKIEYEKLTKYIERKTTNAQQQFGKMAGSVLN